LAADYRCVDFDTGMPASPVWTQTLTNSGTQALTTNRASSAPNSLTATVPAAADYTFAATATLSSQDVGSTPITRVSLSAYLNPVTLGGVAPGWDGSVSLLCVNFGSGQACLNYTYASTSVSFQTTAFTGYYVDLLYTGGGAVRSDCGPTGTVTTLAPNIWTQVELRVDYSSSATVTVLFGGVTMASCAGLFGPDTVSTVSVGARSFAATTYAYTMYYDNIVAYVTHQ
jgi:hypothetical protein